VEGLEQIPRIPLATLPGRAGKPSGPTPADPLEGDAGAARAASRPMLGRDAGRGRGDAKRQDKGGRCRPIRSTRDRNG